MNVDSRPQMWMFSSEHGNGKDALYFIFFQYSQKKKKASRHMFMMQPLRARKAQRRLVSQFRHWSERVAEERLFSYTRSEENCTESNWCVEYLTMFSMTKNCSFVIQFFGQKTEFFSSFLWMLSKKKKNNPEKNSMNSSECQMKKFGCIFLAVIF